MDEGLRRSFKFLARPTGQQEARLTRMLGAHCDLYNAALQERRDAWQIAGVTRRLGDQSADLPWIRANVADQGEWSAWSQQETLRRLDRSFQAFFRRVKAGQTPGFPRFKAKTRWDSVTFNIGNGARWLPETGRLALVGIGHLKVHAHREIRGRIKTVTLRREGRRWFVVFSCDRVPARPLPKTGKRCGVDVGVTVFAALDDGVMFENPKYLAASADDLARLQKTHAATGRRSVKRRRKIGDLHRKVARQRRDFHHKAAYQLVRDHDLIVVEKLPVTNMVRRAKPKPDPDLPGEFLPNGQAAKTGLNRSIHDAGWAQFLTFLDAKAEDAGRRVVKVPAHHTSQMCHQCGHVDAGNRVIQAEFRCLACGHEANADTNAAKNILRLGLVASADHPV